MALPAIVGILSSLLGQEQGGAKRTDISQKRAYFNQLMGMIDPSYQGNFVSSGKTNQGDGGTGSLNTIMGLFGGSGNKDTGDNGDSFKSNDISRIVNSQGNSTANSNDYLRMLQYYMR